MDNKIHSNDKQTASDIIGVLASETRSKESWKDVTGLKNINTADYAKQCGFPSNGDLLGDLPGGCVPRPRTYEDRKNDRYKSGSLLDESKNRESINGGDTKRAVNVSELKSQPGDKVNKIEERPRIIVCPGEGPNPKPQRAHDFSQSHERWDNLLRDLKRPIFE